MSLLLLQGPAGSGKSQALPQFLGNGYDVVADYTAIWAAITGATRDPATGLYPVRTQADAVVRTGLVSYLQAAVVRQALRVDLSAIVTTGSAGQDGKWEAIANEYGADFDTVTIDPGEAVVTERLKNQSSTGELLDECSSALKRWYRRR